MTNDLQHLERLPLAGHPVATDFEGWSRDLLDEFESNVQNPRVGGTLLSADDRVRVWSIMLQPGDRLPFHRHVLDYFWTATSGGRSRQHLHDGTTRDVTYLAGETRHFSFAEGEFLLHDLENVGTTALAFITVEFLDSENHPLPLGMDEGRRR